MQKRTAIFLLLFMALGLAACSQTDTPKTPSCSQNSIEKNVSESEEKDNSTTDSENILIVYFSRYGNTDYPDDVDVSTSASIVIDNERYGTTEYVSRMIQQMVGGEIHRIETAVPYTADFDKLRDVNHDEMQQNILPELKDSDLDISKYDTVFIGYPVWATDVPQAVLSFLNDYDLTGKTVIPFCTHDGYGAGGSYQTIAEASKAEKTLDGLAIEAKDVLSAQDTVTNWLNAIGVAKKAENSGENDKTAIQITVGDITYCEAHHNMAIFYAQTDNPNLSVDVIPIGKVTSDLSVFDDLSGSAQITFALAE